MHNRTYINNYFSFYFVANSALHTICARESYKNGHESFGSFLGCLCTLFNCISKRRDCNEFQEKVFLQAFNIQTVA